MKKIIAYLAMSLNGKIARSDGQVDWLDAIPNPEKSDYGYYAFYDTIDTTIMGHSTYRLLMSWDVEFPYKDKKNYVLCKEEKLENPYVDPIQLEDIAALKNQEGKDIWLIGGGVTNTALLNAGLIDEMIIHIMPIIIPDGIDLFGSIPKETSFDLKDSCSYSSGVMELHYKVTTHNT